LASDANVPVVIRRPFSPRPLVQLDRPSSCILESVELPGRQVHELATPVDRVAHGCSRTCALGRAAAAHQTDRHRTTRTSTNRARAKVRSA